MRRAKFFFFFFLRFTIFETGFIFSLRNKNFKRIGCAKARLLSIDRVEITSDRGSRSQMFFKTRALKSSRNIRKKTPVFESIFNKVALKFFIKKRLQHYFPVNIAKFLKATFVIEHRWLLST